ncbi:integrase [Pandoraea horticolens]|uniref:Integrase n=1 Tax=Pandoraea horticolens TaxID=2508298 RepID=A0A5E4TXK1_9BURK|nr:site-specific integrase [Pandoraea horticolens]VVD91304.1 integrase [Pandoraea horticolens]
MATIRRRVSPAGKISWTAMIRRKGFPALSKTFPSKTLAKHWVTVTEASMIAGTFIDPRPAQAAILRDLFIRYRDEVTPSKRGRAAETVRINWFIQQPIAQYSLGNLKPPVIAAWRDARLRTVTGSTVNRDMNLLGHVLEVARKEWGLHIPLNPVHDVRRPQHNPARDRRLMPGEEARLLAACRSGIGDFLFPAVVLALETGMRRGEIIALDWRKIDTERCIARLEMTKNGERRDVPLSSRAGEALKSVKTPHDGPVFKGWTANAFRLAYIRAVARAGIADLTLHDLRHEAISRMFEKGLSMMEVAAIAGHKTLAMLKRYTHLRAEDLAKKLG